MDEFAQLGNALTFIHSWVRWILVLMWLIAVVKFTLGLIKKSEYDKMSNGVMSGVMGMLDLQATIGIILIVIEGFTRPHIDHAIPMLIAVGLGHLTTRWKEKPAALRYRNGLIVLVAIALLIVAGVMSIGNPWFFRI